MRRIVLVSVIGVAALSVDALLLLGGGYFDDFNDGNADGWLSDQGSWEVRNFEYHGTGRWVNQRNDNVSWVEKFDAIDMSVEGIMYTDPGFDDVNKMLVLRYLDRDNLLVVNFRAGWRADVVISQMVDGQGELITPEFQFPIPQHGQTERKHCRVDLIGKHVIVYFEGRVYIDQEFSQISETLLGSAGVSTFSSAGGGDEEVFLDDFHCGVAGLYQADQVRLIFAHYVSGSPAEMQRSDDRYYVLGSWTGLLWFTQPPLRFETSHFVAQGPLWDLTVRAETHMNTPGTRQVISLHNWNTGQWEQVSSELISVTDRVIRQRITADPDRFVRPITGEVQVRMDYFIVGSLFQFPFRVSVDELRIHAVCR
ncbi:MAG: hypothetical protein IH851_00130 [Armatimonadetes bacterium]|nr:hypothetical protein [Armatimonadota bacterium]